MIIRVEPEADRDFVVTHVNTLHSGASFPQRCVRTSTESLLFQPWADGRTAFHGEAMSGLTFHALAEAAQSDPAIDARVREYVYGIPLAFYDLEHDPDERHNLIHDPRVRSDVERLHALLMEHMQRTGDPQLDPFRRAIAAWRVTSQAGVATAGPDRSGSRATR
jgi:N-sulfoglucosamine sulfohydrolase